jgi:ATP-dependent Clp protease ATP-binding subunit ClpC
VLGRFTEQARQVVVRAQQAAVSLGHSAIQTEHLLLALVGGPGDVVNEVFAELQITIEAVREQVVARQDMERPAPGPGTIPKFHQMPFSPRATKVLELSLRESAARGKHQIGTEHLLLAIARVDDGGAGEILRALGADGERLRSEVLKRLPDTAPCTVLRDRWTAPRCRIDLAPVSRAAPSARGPGGTERLP